MSVASHETRFKSTNRNDVCPCGSGRKYKKCHLAEDEAALRAEQAKRTSRAAAAAAAEAEAEAVAEEAGEGSKEAPGGKAPRPRGAGDPQGAGKNRSRNARPKNLPRRRAV